MEDYNVYEWIIENFSIWNAFVHGQMIPGPVIHLDLHNNQSPLSIGLFPRGLSGQDEQLVVRISEIRKALFGDLSFIVSDGSLRCTRKIHATVYDDVFVSTNGPKFEEVRTLLDTNEDLRKDKLTLRFRIRGYGHKHYMHTVLEAFDSTLKINPEFIKDTVSDTPKIMSVISLPLQSDSQVHLKVWKSFKGYSHLDEVMKLQLKPQNAYSLVFSVSSFLSFLSNDGTLISREKKEHVFHDDVPWTLSDSLTMEELRQRGGSLTLRLKFGMRRDTIRSSSHVLLDKENSFP